MADKSDEEIQRMLVQLENEQLVDVVFIESLASSPDAIAAVASKWGDTVYTSIFKALTHRIYSPGVARVHWSAILEHRETLISQLGRNPGIAVVALDYFNNFSGQQEKLGIIEQSKLSDIAGFATKDELTGLYVRKIFEGVITQQVNEAHRYKQDLCLLMLDIDDFKKFNDTYGHPAGDEILKAIGKVITRTIRDSDIAARYGGEEIAIIAPKTDLQEASALAERLRNSVNQYFNSNHRITISIGIAGLQPGQNKDSLIQAADSALYKAKSRGKNQSVSQEE
ncbi:MAG: GGDEF domain-containing protein [Ketobacteraceae bacterium]|nr:GGDEF domain-containing protein [Ketobacteraceae bacterium]